MKKLTQEEFIKRSIEAHGEKYDYSLVEFKNVSTKVTIICPEHGEFKTLPNVHYMGFNCPSCTGNVKATTETFIEKAKKVHGDRFDYSLVQYKNNKSPVKIICKIHGEFEQRPDRHVRGDGCKKCKNDSMYSSTEEFIEKASVLHDNKFDYSKVQYKNNKSKVTIICPVHGDFKQTPSGHLSGYGCQHCNSSKGEITIKKFLDELQIEYEEEKMFDGCRNKNPLRFDFYIPVLNMCIEFDGIQHYKEIEHWGGKKGLTERINNDNIKTQYCIDNNINLIRISYEQNLFELLSKLFKSKE